MAGSRSGRNATSFHTGSLGRINVLTPRASSPVWGVGWDNAWENAGTLRPRTVKQPEGCAPVALRPVPEFSPPRAFAGQRVWRISNTIRLRTLKRPEGRAPSPGRPAGIAPAAQAGLRAYLAM